jgi:hypothetical protein
VKENEQLHERLEELYLLVESWRRSIGVNALPYFKVMRGEIDYNQALDLTIQFGKDIQLNHNRIPMLINLYFPQLKPVHAGVLKVTEEMNAILAEHKQVYRQGGTRAPEFVAPLREAVLKLESAGSAFHEEISRIAREWSSIDKPIAPQRLSGL